MKFTLLRTRPPKKFNYVPRFYDPEKEAREARKAAMGLDNTLSPGSALKARMDARWRRHHVDVEDSKYKRITILFYVLIAVSSVYLIFFTSFIESILKAFGV
ncbi:MAG: hypothetical protein KKD74_12740 [Bacteroidetes bacterium]|nr:hypothetical protein [Bacteroidales bacterium]MBU1010993.1 hypothetical protein [Bacteroidota bacterium]